MLDAKKFWRCKNGMDLLYHSAKFGGAWIGSGFDLLDSQLRVLYYFLFTKYIMIVVAATSGLVLPTTRCANSHARVHSHSQVCQSKHGGNTCFVVCLL